MVKWRKTKLFWVKQFWVNCSPSYIGRGFWNLWENSELQYLKTTILICWKASRDEEPSQSPNHPTAQVSNINKLSHELKWRKTTYPLFLDFLVGFEWFKNKIKALRDFKRQLRHWQLNQVTCGWKQQSNIY